MYSLTAVILVVLGNPNGQRAVLMNFIIGICMFVVGLIYLLIAIVTCCEWHPVSLCRRCGKENYATDY